MPVVKDPVREAVAVWAAVILGLAAVEVVGLAVPFLRGMVGALAVAAFLYAPMRFLERRGQDARDAGWRFGQVAGNAAVAFSEEFFYRGYMTLRFEEKWSPARAAVVAAALFAAGHLLEPAPWRLAVLFPALLFAWLRWKTGTIVGASIAHFLSNVWLLVLERSSY